MPCDHHVHIQRPELRGLLTKIGLPLLRSEEEHTRLDVILRVQRPGRLFVVSNSYLLAGLGFGERELEKLRAEHDFLAEQVRRHPGRAFGFISVHPLRAWTAGVFGTVHPLWEAAARTRDLQAGPRPHRRRARDAARQHRLAQGGG